jgi:hypothetical protein
MSEFLRIGDQEKSLYAIILYTNRHRRVRLSVSVGHDPGLAIDLSDSRHQTMRYQLAERIGATCHIRGASNRLGRSESFPATNSIEHNVFG